MDSRIGSKWNRPIGIALNNRSNYGPFSLLLIIDLDNVGDRVILGNATKLIDISTIEGTTSEGACLIDHGFNLLDLVADNVESFTSISDDLIIHDTFIRGKLTSKDIYVFVVKTY